ncbi:MAG: precorrin-8X methylmutase [Pseudomonadota bacterium]|nr:precorrin-8X methylmutase [Pseudomonadota bacterium]
MSAVYDYIKDPDVIYAQSFERVRAAVPALADLPKSVAPLVERIIHASAMPDVIDDLIWSDDIVDRTMGCLRQGKPIICDCQMLASGITAKFLPAKNPVIVTLNHADVAAEAKMLGTTRSAAAVDHWHDDIEGAIVAFGNAPTALFHLLERLASGWPKPAAILGFPVGFVGATESKDALIADAGKTPFITIKGRRGGSAMAAAAVNALAIMASAATDGEQT